MFEVWLCVIEVVEQNVKLMLTTPYFTKKSKAGFLQSQRKFSREPMVN